MRRMLGDRQGAAAIEFAAVLGIVVTLLLATMQIGFALKTRAEISHALGQVVRQVYIDPHITPLALSEQLAARLEGFEVHDLAVNVAPVDDLRLLRVGVSFPFTLSVPLIAHATITMRVETLTPALPPEG